MLQNSQENTCVRVSFLKKIPWHRCFPVNFAKLLRTPFFVEHPWWMLLNIFLYVVNPFHSTGFFLYPLETSENVENGIFFPKIALLSGSNLCAFLRALQRKPTPIFLDSIKLRILFPLFTAAGKTLYYTKRKFGFFIFTSAFRPLIYFLDLKT